MRLNIEKIVVNVEPVKKLCICFWSFILCMISPVIFVSKKLIGSLISLIRKSVNIEILTLTLICNKIHDLINSTLTRPMIKEICAIKIISINARFLVFIPISTIDCVRNGAISCNKLPTSSPKIN